MGLIANMSLFTWNGWEGSYQGESQKTCLIKGLFSSGNRKAISGFLGKQGYPQAV
jgi:hypothetical protein